MDARAPIPVGHYHSLKSGHRLHYLEAGTQIAGRPTVLFLHGSGPGASGYSNFKGNYPAFVDRGFHVLVVDYIGYGLSDQPADIDYTFDLHVGAVRELLVAKGIERVVPVGNSMGGAISLLYTLAWPEQVSKLILMAPGGLEDPQKFVPHSPGLQVMFQWTRERPTDEAAFRALMAQLVHDAADITDTAVAERFSIALKQPAAVFAFKPSPSGTPLSFEERLHEIRCPVLAFWGSHDRFLPVRQALILLERVAKARVVISNQAGHWYMIEERDDFNRQCLSFLIDG